MVLQELMEWDILAMGIWWEDKSVGSREDPTQIQLLDCDFKKMVVPGAPGWL